MRIAISGASGFIGSALAISLRNDGHEVLSLVRRPETNVHEITWDPRRGQLDANRLIGVDAVVNLAGAGLGDRRWNARYKEEILQSRVQGTATIARAVAQAGVPVLVSGSAIGFYGDTGDTAVDESAPHGEGFLAQVCIEWEQAAQSAESPHTRVAVIRTGLVAATSGGAFGRMLPLFRFGLGGPLGSGRQYWSTISLTDHVRAMRFLTEHDVRGPVNLTAPTPVTNREFARALAKALHRPALVPAPAFALRAILGEFSQDILGSQRVLPRRLLDAGFTFAHPTVQDITASLV